MDLIYEKIASIHGIKPEEVEMEINRALKLGRECSDRKVRRFWSELGSTVVAGDVIKYILCKIK